MKTFLLFFLLLTGIEGFSQAKRAQVSHTIQCDIGDFMVMGLQESSASADSTDAGSDSSSTTTSTTSTGQRQLVINSNFAFNIVVDEKYSGPSFSYAMSSFRPEEEGHGPSTSQLSGIKKLRYFRMIEDFKKITLLYTIAPY